MFRHVCGFIGLSTAVLLVVMGNPSVQVVHFDKPIDAVSVGVQTHTIDLAVSWETENGWSKWEKLELEKEFDPMMRESNLIIFGAPTTNLRLRGTQTDYEIHPLRTDSAPPRIALASRRTFRKPRILTRAQWGADESLLIGGTGKKPGEIIREDGGDVSARATACRENQTLYPDEFRTTKIITHDRQGNPYLWPRRYSSDVDLFVVHHTAENSSGADRPGWERMRLLHQFHTVSRGWGDVGYHFIIDEEGQIYEGRAGGKYVVGGHAYCSNVRTIGVALMGNFDEEQPTQTQMRSLQWLLADLADEYNVDLAQDISWRGKPTKRIIGHFNVTSTSCPGHYVRETLSQVRRNVRRGELTRDIKFPRGKPRTEGVRRSGRAWYSSGKGHTLTPSGSLDLTGRPGDQTRVSLKVTAGDTRIQNRERIAVVERSTTRIGLWQELNGLESRVRSEVIMPKEVRKGQSATLRLLVQYPSNEGIYTLKIGDVSYILNVKGRPVQAKRRLTTSRLVSEIKQSSRPSKRSFQNLGNLGRSTSFGARRSRSSLLGTASSRASRRAPARRSESDLIRIRLGYDRPTAAVQVPRGTTINGTPTRRFRVDLAKVGSDCVAREYGEFLGQGVIRIEAGNEINTISSWNQSSNRFRGTIECRVVDGELVLINELPLELYMAGLAEEPDSEPYEKQRAFAIAARSYAAHYMSPDNRKFPDKPYDGNDSPASFQKYTGVLFEEKNPRWVEAVLSTNGLVVMRRGQIVKTPYFSASNGRTLSPSQAGWGNFPFASVFSSKLDPWCEGMKQRGHGVGMSGCGAFGQAKEGKTGEQILNYYYPGTTLERL